MVEHEIVFDKNKVEYNIFEDINILRDKCSKKELFSSYGIPVSFVNGKIKKDGTKGVNFFRSHSEYLFENGVKYYHTEPMTEEHLKTQKLLKEHFKDAGCILEKRFPEISRIADVFFVYDNKKYVIEVQRSRYDFNKYKSRTEEYKKLGVGIIWLCIADDDESFSQRNFNNSICQNGGYLLYIPKNNLNLQEIKKVIYDETENSFKLYKLKEQQDLFNFMFDKFFGIDINLNIRKTLTEMESYENWLESLKRENILEREKLNDIRYTIKNIENSISDKQKKQINLDKKNYELSNKIKEKMTLLEKPLAQKELLLTQIEDLNKEKNKIFDVRNQFKKECESIKLIRDKINISEEILELLKKNQYLVEYTKGNFEIIL